MVATGRPAGPATCWLVRVKTVWPSVTRVPTLAMELGVHGRKPVAHAEDDTAVGQIDNTGESSRCRAVTTV
jgi:hypothetical protein